MSTVAVSVRAATASDDADLRQLCAQLGYDASPAEVAERRAHLTSDPTQGLFVAVREERLAGFVHVYRRQGLETAPVAQVQAIVVDETTRRHGVATVLLEAAEAWARQNGLSSVSLYCDVRRDDAHEFYAGCGYELAVSASRFVKRLD